MHQPRRAATQMVHLLAGGYVPEVIALPRLGDMHATRGSLAITTSRVSFARRRLRRELSAYEWLMSGSVTHRMSGHVSRGAPVSWVRRRLDGS